MIILINVFKKLIKQITERKVRKRFSNSVIYPEAYISDDSNIQRSCVIFSGSKIISSQIGSYSYVQSNSTITNAIVGPYCAIASNVMIGLANHPTSMISISPVFYDNTQPLPNFFVREKLFSASVCQTIIGADVWIGHGALIKSGLEIGVGSVIGAGSVITKDVPPYTIVAGNPGRIIRDRFSDELRNSMINSRWWELDEEILIEFSSYFSDPQKFIDKINEIQRK
jgi:acetyltransferase-like isoleucine patch superfamily enzyme